MSFDLNGYAKRTKDSGLNPFGTGQCLSTFSASVTVLDSVGLNPFGTGQCLSTIWWIAPYTLTVSIPLEQGNVFRRYRRELK